MDFLEDTIGKSASRVQDSMSESIGLVSGSSVHGTVYHRMSSRCRQSTHSRTDWTNVSRYGL